MLCLGCIALAVEVVMTLFNSPQFMIRKTIVHGNRLVPVRQVLQDVRFATGQNIFLVKDKAIVRTLTRNPIIASVHIHRKLPRTLIVDVTERRPCYVLNTGTAFYEVDRSGIPYRIMPAEDPGLSAIVCGVSERVILGKPLRSPTVAKARECLLLAQSKKIFSAVEITVDQTGCLCLNVRDKFQVKMGRPDQLSDKLNLVQRVLGQVPEFKQRGMYIDVTCPDAPAFKLADSSAE